MPANPSSPTRRARRGFTLVELLMVVVVIGLLMALLLPAIGRARLTAQRGAITAEISQLNAAMAQFASNYNEFPPNHLGSEWGGDTNYGQKYVVRFFRKAFPRYNVTGWEQIRNEIYAATEDFPIPLELETMTAAEALVFWLGGFANAQKEMQGFSKNPLNPIQGVGTPNFQGTTPLFDFDANRLADRNGNGWPEYYPANTNLRAPYVYFGALYDGKYAGAFSQPSTVSPGASGVARPYKTDAGGFVNPKTCQIIWSGFDFDYGADNINKQFPSGVNYGTGDYDNQTNFVTGILEDSLP
mgnify:FL=1